MEAVLRTKLRRDPARSSLEWDVWERKTLNIHRGVLHWHPSQEPPAYADISRAVRDKVAETYRRSWWRGFAFGVVADLARVPGGIETSGDDIDTRDNRKGTWQWSVLAFRDPKVVVGIHTWQAGYLTSVYEALLAGYGAAGYEVGTFGKEKDKLMQFLTSVAGLGLPEFDLR